MKKIDIKELKIIQFNILKTVAEFCEANKIEYFLWAGTLLGAVRHKGYIPWDDDIDICMRREEYNKFFMLFNRNRIDSLFAINADNTTDYYAAYGKVINTDTVMKEVNNFNNNIGVYIDVFPMDDLPTDMLKVRLLDFRLRPYRYMLILKTIKVVSTRKWHKNLILKIGEFVIKPISIHWILKRINSLSTKYDGQDNCSNIAAIAILTHGFNELFSQSDFNESCELTFEGVKFKCPVNYRHILKNFFGDYMKLPSAENRKSHHAYEAYWK
ncbi:lipopolysaccharide cholinephosphotransferase [Succiniclasticum ruminis]|uniref:Lipopolysaccharide cholinephosphotransferase n=1 Tax=Succiniclasticum ruminis TaxID=40841 RepID=A0A1G6HQ96_9FIRM|nr:LicD family protein [Succiniclasticum ruminis]SDB95666.1 lipopolysaccharide cholinephosphotransferase [Succiniclasticum ruminis]